MAVINVNVYDGNEYTIYSKESAECNISVGDGIVEIVGNEDCLILLARQMVYFASNNFCLPFGTHIHYDSFLHSGFQGEELILEVIRVPKEGIILDSNEEIQVELPVPEHANDLEKCWTENCKVFVTCNVGSVYLLGNAKGLRFLAIVLLFLATKGGSGSAFTCDNQRLIEWGGMSIKFVHR